jgi:hypothetical protein
MLSQARPVTYIKVMLCPSFLVELSTNDLLITNGPAPLQPGMHRREMKSSHSKDPTTPGDKSSAYLHNQ